MNCSNFQIRLLLCLSLIAIAPPTLRAVPRCPASIAGVTPRFVRRALIVIPVKVNHAGPFDFIVDTGTQITAVDPSLASELSLKPQGTVALVSAASHAHAAITVVNTLETAFHLVERPLVIIQDLAPFQAADSRIRGVLGENFLAHFDLLIDYRQKLLCLDDKRTMRDEVHGEHTPLVTPKHPENELPFLERLVISVHLSGTGTQQVLLQLDSGGDVPVLYQKTNLSLLESAVLLESSMSNTRVPFAAFEPQVMQIGTRMLSHISFLTPVSVAKDMPARAEDGLLPTVLFQRIFICHADHYVVFDPR